MPLPLRRILVIRLSSIGDIVHTLPAVSALGRALPEAEIHWAIERRYSSLLHDNPYLRRVIELDTLGWRAKPQWRQAMAGLARLVQDIRKFDYDAALDFQGLIKTGLLARLSRSPVRIGFARPWLREPAAAIFYTDCARPASRRHVVELHLAIAEKLGARNGKWEFPLPKCPEAESDVEDRLARLGAREFLIVNPGGGWKAKRWPPGRYAALLRRLAEIPAKTLLTGSPAEEPLIHEILAGASPTRAAYFPSTLPQFIALARRARLFVGGDTGPMHIAAAVSTPIVAIFDASDTLNTVERNGPFHPADITLTDSAAPSKLHRRKDAGYLSGVSVDSVFAAVGERWRRAYG